MVAVVAFTIAYLLGKVITKMEGKYPQLQGKKSTLRSLPVFVIIVGFLEAFSAGMNNVANAVGPLVGAGLEFYEYGILLGGIHYSLWGLCF